MIKEFLAPLGFSDEEAAVYLMLLESGPLPAGRLAQRCGLVRSSLYGILDRLAQKGIVKWDEGPGGIRRYRAESPGVLRDILSRRRADLENAEKNILAALPALQKKMGGRHVAPRLSLYQGRSQLQNVLSDSAFFEQETTFSFWPIRSMMQVLGEEYFLKLNIGRIKRRTFVKAIWPEEQTVDVADYPFMGSGPGYRREVRIAPASMNSPMGYWIYGPMVAVLSSIEECFGFVVESMEFAEMMRLQHALVWQHSRPMVCAGRAVETFLAAHGDAAEMRAVRKKGK